MSTHGWAGAAVVERGSPDSFEDFFASRYEPLLRALFLITGDRHEAEDLAQEAFFRVYGQWDRIRGTENPAGYAYRVAVNVYHSRLRRLAVAARRALKPEQADHLKAADDRDSIRRALSHLSRGQREAVVLIEWVGLSDRAVAEILGVAASTVRVRLSRGRRRLQWELRGEIDG